MSESIPEKIGELRSMAKAAHQRLDKLEVEIKARLDHIDEGMASILKELHVNQGSKMAWVYIAGAAVAVLGSSLTAIVTYYLSKGG